MDGIFNSTRKVYMALEDEISRNIFTARLNFSATGDFNFIRKIPMKYRNLSADIENFSERLYGFGKERLVVFGAGNNGINLVLGFKNLSFFCFVDNYKKEAVEKTTGLSIYSLNGYKEKFGLDDSRFIISVSNRDSAKNIHKQLIDNGVKQDRILVAVADWRNNSSQYFDLFVPQVNESFVDCGCFDGSTAFRFAGWCADGGVTYDKIWSFEPDKSSFERCKKIINSLNRCELYPYGVSDKNEVVSFIASGNEDARIIKNNVAVKEKENVQSIEVVKLDDFLRNEKVTFIKMDIEGAEYDALKGATQIIKEQKPRLAISVYHNAYHIITIPELLLSLREDYKLYLRHYSLLANETILYAE